MAKLLDIITQLQRCIAHPIAFFNKTVESLPEPDRTMWTSLETLRSEVGKLGCESKLMKYIDSLPLGSAHALVANKLILTGQWDQRVAEILVEMDKIDYTSIKGRTFVDSLGSCQSTSDPYFINRCEGVSKLQHPLVQEHLKQLAQLYKLRWIVLSTEDTSDNQPEDNLDLYAWKDSEKIDDSRDHKLFMNGVLEHIWNIEKN